MQPSRIPKNEAERRCYLKLQKEGWVISKRGWPDFFCMRDGKIIVVEVKRSNQKYLRAHQYEVMQALSGFGVECFLWTPANGFTPIRSVERKPARRSKE